MSDEQRERMRSIGKTLSDAMAQRTDCDWSRDTPVTAAAQVALDEAVTSFILGTALYRFEDPQYATREDVRAAYKQYAEMHVR